MENDQSNLDSGVVDSQPEGKAARVKPLKSLPTDRLSFDKQLITLRAFAKASGPDRAWVSNNDVARYADIGAASVSLGNSFWTEAGLLIREGNKLRPIEAVFNFDQAAEWTPELAANKLAEPLAISWFGRAMLTKLAMKPCSVNEALIFLAQECRASTDYKTQLKMLLDYLQAAGLITNDGTTITKTAVRTDAPPPPPSQSSVSPADNPDQTMSRGDRVIIKPGAKRITIALPDKDDVMIEIPEDFDADDWILVADHLAGYIKRWKKFQSTPALKDATKDD